MLKQSVLLITTMTVMLSTGLTHAREVEVKAGNVEVSVQNRKVEVDTGYDTRKTPSLLERLSNFRLFPATTSSKKYPLKCDRSSYNTSNRHASGGGTSQTSSSSTTIVCQ